MFKSARITFLVLGALLIGITLFIGFLFVDPANRTNAFWYTISGIMLSEAFLALTAMDLGGNHGDRALPFRFANGLVGIFYFVFALLMLIAFACDVEARTILVLEILGLFAALIVYFLLGLATRATSDQAAQFRAERVNKKRFKVEIEFIRTDVQPLLASNETLAKKFSKLSDLARFAPESLAGVEDLDQEIFDWIVKLQNAGEAKTETEIEAAVDKLVLLFQKRQILTKELR